MRNAITSINARQILDSRGNPTIETTIATELGIFGKASVPSGASVGKFEAVELRDNNKEYYQGKSVLKAVQNINDCLNKALIGQNVFSQYKIDKIMIDLDETNNKSNLGANAILSVSLAVARCAAQSANMQLFRYIGGINSHIMPVPMINIINGGAHANNDLDFQEFMIAPVGFKDFSSALEASNNVFHTLKTILNEEGYSTSVGDEGGFAPELEGNEQAIEMIMKSIETAGYDTDKIKIALDVAASEFYENNHYNLQGENLYLNSEEMVNYLGKFVEKYPILSIEDGMAEDDIDGWKKLTERFTKEIMLVGDDLMVTNPVKIATFILDNIANSVLIKPNQIGTLTETMQSVEISKNGRYNTIISHRSGETADTFIADLAVGLNAGYIKTGSLSRSERTEKYNRLLEIEKILKNNSIYSLHF